MLEKMGWKLGKGLGALEDGSKEHLKIKLKTNNLGIGADLKTSQAWLGNTDAFSTLLKQLNQTATNDDTEGDLVDDTGKAPEEIKADNGDGKESDEPEMKKRKKDKKDKKKKKDEKDKKAKKGKKSKKHKAEAAYDDEIPRPCFGQASLCDKSITSTVVKTTTTIPGLNFQKYVAASSSAVTETTTVTMPTQKDETETAPAKPIRN